VKRITSPGNPRFKALHQLVESARERKKSGLSVLDGVHLVSAYREGVGPPEQIVVSDSGSRNPEIKQILAGAAQVETLLLSDGMFKQVAQVVTPTGILAVIKTPRPRPLPDKMDACLMLEDLQDPGNLGSILRSAAAAGIRHVLLSRNTAHAWSPRVLRAGMGAHFMLRIYEQADLQAAARVFAGTVIATAWNAPRSLYDVDLRGKLALLFGNEGSGLSPQLKAAAHMEVSVPTPGNIESLNVAAAVAVCLFERVRQLSAVSSRRSARPGITES